MKGRKGFKMVRFLKKEEYQRIRELNLICFQDPEWVEEQFGKERKAGQADEAAPVYENRIAVKEVDGEIVSLLQLVPMQAYSGTEVLPVDYIFGVCTHPEHRRKGYMNEVLRFACEAMREEKKPWTFLVAVNKEIYRHLGFLYDWRFRKEEKALLGADDGLTDCSAKLLCAASFVKPERIEKRTEEASFRLM